MTLLYPPNYRDVRFMYQWYLDAIGDNNMSTAELPEIHEVVDEVVSLVSEEIGELNDDPDSNLPERFTNVTTEDNIITITDPRTDEQYEITVRHVSE